MTQEIKNTLLSIIQSNAVENPAEFLLMIMEPIDKVKISQQLNELYKANHIDANQLMILIEYISNYKQDHTLGTWPYQTLINTPQTTPDTTPYPNIGDWPFGPCVYSTSK